MLLPFVVFSGNSTSIIYESESQGAMPMKRSECTAPNATLCRDKHGFRGVPSLEESNVAA